MRWASPWGDGFPGWHLECTVMSTKYLGDYFDIHGGGMDLKFPHHECEIAQAKGSNGHEPVKYWMHANMLTMNGQRMSKSTGNYILPMQLVNGENDFFEKPFHPAVVRFCFLQAHYRSVLDISNDAMLASEKGYNRLVEALKTLETITPKKTSTVNIDELEAKLYTAMDDDFNTPILIAHLFDAVKMINSIKDSFENITVEDLERLKAIMNGFVHDVLGLDTEAANESSDKLDGVVKMLIEMRNQARVDKNWALSDQIRDQLSALGIQLKDGADGTTFTF